MAAAAAAAAAALHVPVAVLVLMTAHSTSLVFTGLPVTCWVDGALHRNLRQPTRCRTDGT